MKPGLPFKLAGALASILLLESVAWAIEGGGAGLPGSTMPETVSKSLTSEQPTANPQALPPIAKAKEKAPSPLGEQAKKIKFKLNGIVLEDNRVYSDAQLLPLYRNKLHKTISVAELFDIVQDITNYYRNNGYILSRAVLPPQHVKNGIVHVKVIEGYIANVDVTGNPHGAKRLVLGFGCKIKACRPTQLSRMEKYLLIANEIPATEVKAVLSPSKSEVGAADLTLVTQNKPITGYFSYDNYGTRYIGPQQMTGNVALNSFFTSGDQTQFTMTKTPKGHELTYMDLNYNTALDANGTRWLLGATKAHTDPLFVLAPAKIDGINSNYYTMFSFPVIRKRTSNLTLRAGFNYLDSYVTTLDVPLYTDHVRSLDFGGTYNFTDSWYGANLISLDLRKGMPIFGYTSDTNIATAQTSRPGGHADYNKAAGTISRLQAIKGPFSLYGVFQGQWAPEALLASEQYTFGGSQLGRGYDVAELIGDQGIGGGLELRYDKGIGKFYLQAIQLFAFYDVGMIWNYNFIGGTPRKQSATSTGLGLRFFTTKYVTGSVFWAQPLTKSVAALQNEEPGLRGNGRAPRVFFSVVANLG